jgi:hypothetical protein
MKIHKLRSNTFEDFLTIPNLITHIIVGLAEMNSNAEMFGGVNSDSYKIKYKNFDKYAKRVLFQLIEKIKTIKLAEG